MTSAEQVPVRGTVPVEWVARRMRAIGAGLPPADGVAVFNRVYLCVTEELRQRLAGGGFAAGGGAAAGLGARVAARYLTAVEAAVAGRPVPASWRPLFQLRRHPAVLPPQFALAGLNAHIGHDLPLALADTCRLRRAVPRLLEGDFDEVGELLAGLEERIRDELMPGPDVLDVTDPLTHLVGAWSVDQACESAWAAFRTVWELRAFPELAQEFTARLDAGTGLVGRCLLTPLERGRTST